MPTAPSVLPSTFTLDAPGYGVSALQCASGRGGGRGTSNPPAERVVANLRALGHTVTLNDEALARVSKYFHPPGAVGRSSNRPATGL